MAHHIDRLSPDRRYHFRRAVITTLREPHAPQVALGAIVDDLQRLLVALRDREISETHLGDLLQRATVGIDQLDDAKTDRDSRALHVAAAQRTLLKTIDELAELLLLGIDEAL